jgi:LacI family transcriptional regulator
MSSYLAPTLNDVAQKAGVSTATVSRCLNSPERVSKRTRDRVKQAINVLSYTPNFGARVMASKRTYTIGAIIPTMENAIFARGIQAFQDELHIQGYTLLVASSSYDLQIEEEQIRTLVSRGVDGLLLIGHDRSPEIIDFLEKKNIPALVAWAHNPKAKLSSIGFDNFAAMGELARHVLSLGHKRIGMISAWIKTNDRARARVMAVRHVLSESGLNASNLKLIETDYGIETGAVAFEQIMQCPKPPTVIICGNDVLAAGALKQASMTGIEIPGDVSVTGFDDIDLASIVLPRLTTVHVPHREMGKRSAKSLVKLVEGQTIETTTELNAELKIRKSLIHPKNGNENI